MRIIDSSISNSVQHVRIGHLQWTLQHARFKTDLAESGRTLTHSMLGLGCSNQYA